MVCLVQVTFSQQAEFPQSWTGNWSGELSWYKTGKTDPEKVKMQLRIQPDSAGRYTWQLVYGQDKKDNRPYFLLEKDRAKNHWVIDENNGIIIDQFWVGNKLSGAFTVQNTTIMNTYWLENDTLYIEFYSISAKPLSKTGAGTDESPTVDSYKINSYQRAVLTRKDD